MRSFFAFLLLALSALYPGNLLLAQTAANGCIAAAKKMRLNCWSECPHGSRHSESCVLACDDQFDDAKTSCERSKAARASQEIKNNGDTSAKSRAEPDCLYAFSQGEERVAVEPCGGDVIGIGDNANVIAVMHFFAIQPNVVSFRACPGGRFSARPHETDSNRFVITYPSSIKSDYLAAVAHELAHVVQIRKAGGLHALNPKANSRRVELGADFLAGLAYNGLNLKFGNFETSLNLIGSYNSSKTDDHGLPGHRSQAFRLGAVRNGPYAELTTFQALDYFYGNHYGGLVR